MIIGRNKSAAPVEFQLNVFAAWIVRTESKAVNNMA